MRTHFVGKWQLSIFLLTAALLLAGCSSAPESGQETSQTVASGANDDQGETTEMLRLPELTAAELDGGPLKVMATTSIIGDVVAQVGGDAIDLTTLISPGQDAHSFEPGTQTLASVAGTHVIFINGWDLEEALAHDLEEIAGDTPVVPISANIAPLAAGDTEHEDEHEHSGADPHVWFSVQNVKKWVENVARVLGELDPSNIDTYESNAAGYLAELDTLESYAASELAQIPPGKRFLVTNHDAFSYFARDYGFTVLGTVIPGASTLAEPSAGDLAELIAVMNAHAVCTIFTETTMSSTLAQTVSAELDACDEVRVVALYTSSVGPAGSGADSYIGMFQANVDSIVEGLSE